MNNNQILKELMIQDLSSQHSSEMIDKFRTFTEEELIELFYQKEKCFDDFVKKHSNKQVKVIKKTASVFDDKKSVSEESFNSFTDFMKKYDTSSGTNPFRYYSYAGDGYYYGSVKIPLEDFLSGNVWLTDSNSYSNISFKFSIKKNIVNVVINYLWTD